ncbi:protein of unknown function [Pararobbsia alpina]
MDGKRAGERKGAGEVRERNTQLDWNNTAQARRGGTHCTLQRSGDREERAAGGCASRPGFRPQVAGFTQKNRVCPG